MTMKKPFHRFLSKKLFILSLFSSVVYATDYVRLPDIRSIGMGGNEVTQSIFYNPALVAGNGSKNLHTGYFNRYDVKELNTLYAGFTYDNAMLPTSIDLFSFGYADYRANMFRLSVAKPLNRQWRAGISVQSVFLHSLLYEEVPKTISTDIGICYVPVEKLLIGAAVMHFPAFSSLKNNVDLKGLINYTIQVGFQWEFINNLLIVASAGSNEMDALIGSFGMEYRLFSQFYVRTGISSHPILPTMGAGFVFSHFKVDVAAVLHPVLGVNTGLSIGYVF